MCQRVTCKSCGKPTYAGCGRHIEAVLGDAGYEVEVSALMKTSKNKEDAKQFLDWLLTLDAAKLYGERAEMSSVPGAKPTEAVLKAGLPADVSTVLYKMDFDKSAKEKDRILTEWKQNIER